MIMAGVKYTGKTAVGGFFTGMLNDRYTYISGMLPFMGWIYSNYLTTHPNAQ